MDQHAPCVDWAPISEAYPERLAAWLGRQDLRGVVMRGREMYTQAGYTELATELRDTAELVPDARTYEHFIRAAEACERMGWASADKGLVLIGESKQRS